MESAGAPSLTGCRRKFRCHRRMISGVENETMMKFCPGCGAPGMRFDSIKKFSCGSCGWEYFHNVAAATMAVLTVGERILFTIRADDPGRGMLDLPGGFADPDETSEESLARELREELGLEGLELTYLGSASNTYPFGGVVYKSCDSIYTAALDAIPPIRDEKEITGLELLGIDEIDPARIAFVSVRRAIELWATRR
jgi:NAD+ diphosphatase